MSQSLLYIRHSSVSIYLPTDKFRDSLVLEEDSSDPTSYGEFFYTSSPIVDQAENQYRVISVHKVKEIENKVWSDADKQEVGEYTEKGFTCHIVFEYGVGRIRGARLGDSDENGWRISDIYSPDGVAIARGISYLINGTPLLFNDGKKARSGIRKSSDVLNLINALTMRKDPQHRQNQLTEVRRRLQREVNKFARFEELVARYKLVRGLLYWRRGIGEDLVTWSTKDRSLFYGGDAKALTDAYLMACDEIVKGNYEFWIGARGDVVQTLGDAAVGRVADQLRRGVNFASEDVLKELPEGGLAFLDDAMTQLWEFVFNEFNVQLPIE